ncbi:MAG: sugar kinase [Eubacteriales bacterium]|nr:sugar kinase [Eubacteriales bacterium]
MNKTYDILAVGFPLVEIMRTKKGVPFEEPGEFTGPYPSGDTCIMLDVAARLGKKCCFIGTVGEDGFGAIVTDRLARDGVDVCYVNRKEGYNTAAVFVRYEEDGTRQYLDFINNSACMVLGPEDIPAAVVADSRIVHFSGEIISNCQTGARREAMEKTLASVSKDALVSLDPNFTISIEDMEAVMGPFVKRADIILPSEGEAKVLMGTKTDEEACRKLSAQGKIVALKQGAAGCTIYKGDKKVHAPAYRVEEVDPTGCGDSFCAGFLYGVLENWELEKTGQLANAAGALQATRLGPMEGAMYFEEVMEFIKCSRQTEKEE